MLMILARLVRSESFWAVVKVRSPHTGPEVCYIIAREDALPYEHPLQDAFRRAGAAAAARADAVVLDEGWEGDENYFDLYDDS